MTFSAYIVKALTLLCASFHYAVENMDGTHLTLVTHSLVPVRGLSLVFSEDLVSCSFLYFIVWKRYSINWFLLSPFHKKFEKSLETFVFGYFVVIFVAESPFALSEVLMEFSKYQSVTKSTRRCTLGKTDANRLNCNMLKYFRNCPHHWYQCHEINSLHRVFFWSTCTLYIEIFIKYWSMWDTRKP